MAAREQYNGKDKHVTAPRDAYRQRLEGSLRRLAAHERTHIVYGNVRVGMVALGIAIGGFSLRGTISAWWLLALAAPFTFAVVAHARVLVRVDRARRACRLYQRGIDRIDDRWAEQGAGAARDGASFGAGHPYARDLDIFGPGSLFQRLNAAQTVTGERALADWLRSGAPIEEVRARQAAVDELRGMLDFREDLAVVADEAQAVDSDRLLQWAQADTTRFPTAAPLLLGACGLVTIALAVLAYEDLLPWSGVFVWLLVEVAVVYVLNRPLQAVRRDIDLAEHDLASVAGLLRRIEAERFTAPWLRARQTTLVSRGVAASSAIARLEQLVSLLESTTHNLLFAPFTQALLIPQHIVMALGRWHATHGQSVAEWLRVTAELEAAASLAAYAFERPGDPFPELLDEGAHFEATGLAHPLIADGVVVRNDVLLGGVLPHVLVVSGSNMSGKSTLLRAAGLNIVLALAGAPVRAVSLRLSHLSIGATLRIDDSVQERTSRFYAEILKIRGIVDLARTRPPVAFLLDEILHGTNSHDRRLGAEAVIRELAGLGAIGLVTTHDLALTDIASALAVPAANVHFEDRLEEGRMVFDYRMRPGVVEHSNALALMRAVGLDV